VGQIHYAVERPAHDTNSGIKVRLTDAHIPFSAGMMMFASTFQIPPRQESHLVPNQCCYSGFEPAHGFAYRVHTHMLGRWAVERCPFLCICPPSLSFTPDCQMRHRRCQPDAIVYNAVVDALWETGVMWAQRQVGLLSFLEDRVGGGDPWDA